MVRTGNERLTSKDTLKSAVMKMSDGNPGAINVMMGLASEFGDTAIFTILRLDSLGLYGSDIWLAYKDVCNSDLCELDRMVTRDEKKLIAKVRAAGGLL